MYVAPDIQLFSKCWWCQLSWWWWWFQVATTYNHLGARAEVGVGTNYRILHIASNWSQPRKFGHFHPKLEIWHFLPHLSPQILLKVNVHNIPETYREWSHNSSQISPIWLKCTFGIGYCMSEDSLRPREFFLGGGGRKVWREITQDTNSHGFFMKQFCNGESIIGFTGLLASPLHYLCQSHNVNENSHCSRNHVHDFLDIQ